MNEIFESIIAFLFSVAGFFFVTLPEKAYECIHFQETISAHHIEKKISSFALLGNGTQFSLSECTDFDWDRVYIFLPYTPPDLIEGRIGKKFERSGLIEGSDTINFLVFLKANEVVRSSKVRRSFGDFSQKLGAQCFFWTNAIFEIKRPNSNSWIYIVKGG